MIKAIETVYKGYRFRSRLEARWAVFFDALDLKWEYEREGIILPNGKYYLPDFWLPSFEMIWEVKPDDADLYTIHWEMFPVNFEPFDPKAEDIFCTTSPTLPLVLVAGPPWDYRTYECGYNSNCDEPQYWSCCPKCNRVGFTFCGWAGYIGCGCYMGVSSHGEWRHVGDYKFHGHKTERIETAIAAAKQARFEHGENGTRRSKVM